MGKEEPVTSSLRTDRRVGSTLRPWRIWALVCSRSLRAVATTGRSVLLRRRRASWRPMPRDAGVARSHGFRVIYSLGIAFMMW